MNKPAFTPRDHVVIAGSDGTAYSSLRRRPVSRRERYGIGRALRKRVPRSSLALWHPPAVGRPDPVELIIESHRGRVERLIPVRVARMAASPYGYLRGSLRCGVLQHSGHGTGDAHVDLVAARMPLAVPRTILGRARELEAGHEPSRQRLLTTYHPLPEPLVDRHRLRPSPLEVQEGLAQIQYRVHARQHGCRGSDGLGNMGTPVSFRDRFTAATTTPSDLEPRDKHAPPRWETNRLGKRTEYDRFEVRSPQEDPQFLNNPHEYTARRTRVRPRSES